MTIKKAAKRFLTSARKKTTTTAKKTTVKRKPAIKTLNRTEVEGLIQEQAYKLYEQRGYTNGADIDDWLEAERIVTKK